MEKKTKEEWEIVSVRDPMSRVEIFLHAFDSQVESEAFLLTAQRWRERLHKTRYFKCVDLFGSFFFVLNEKDFSPTYYY